MNDNDKRESDKDSEGNSMEKMPKKKVRKFVPIEREDKELQLALENETSDSRKKCKNEALGDDFEQEADQLKGDVERDQNKSHLEKEEK